ncbi:hypothetical protein ACFL35_19940 [Candidatus Riflebacteria bacterium]
MKRSSKYATLFDITRWSCLVFSDPHSGVVATWDGGSSLFFYKPLSRGLKFICIDARFNFEIFNWSEARAAARAHTSKIAV